MTPIDTFSLQKHEGKYEDRPLTSSLHFEGKDTSKKVPGYVIERQFELADYYLLLINWDCPFEEGCEVVVLSKLLKIVGCYSFKPFYNSYLLSSIRELSYNHYELVFNDSDHFELTVSYPKRRLLSKVVTVRKIAL